MTLKFLGAKIENMPEIEDDMRAFMESFRIKGENK